MMAETRIPPTTYDRMTRTGDVIVQPIPQNWNPSALHHEDSFRVFNLQPSEDPTSRIYGVLEEKRLQEYENELIEHFTAVSYCWGTRSQMASISVNDRDYQVTKNAESVLRSVRDTTRVLSLWIDSICINQHDIDERKHQVSQMLRVYNAATHTIIYLGESNEQSAGSIRVLQKLHELFLKSEHDQAIGVDFLYPDDAEWIVRKQDFKMGILSREWFTRTWVLQELIASRDPWIQCGILKMRWKDMYNCWDFEDTSSYGYEGLWGSFIEYEQARKAHAAGERPDLREILLAAHRRQSKASDPRDQIFALLGIANTSKMSRSIMVDYSKSCRDVYIEAATTFLSDTSLLISLATETNMVGSKSGLPSWVPNWSSSIGQSQMEDISILHWESLKCFNIREGYTGWPVPMPNQILHIWGPVVIPEASLLVTQGCPIGTVSSVSVNSFDLFSDEELRSPFWDMACNESYGRTSVLSRQAFFRCNNHFSGITSPEPPYFGVCLDETAVGDIVGYLPRNHPEHPSGRGIERLFIFRPVIISDNERKTDYLVERELEKSKNQHWINRKERILNLICIGECHIIGHTPQEHLSKAFVDSSHYTHYAMDFWKDLWTSMELSIFVLH